jgi:2Fe-2S ferredoxin
MPKIQIKRSAQVIEVASGENLMSALMAAGLPVASSCHGDGICAKCGVFVESAGVPAAEALSPLTEDEAGFRERGALPEGKRLSCQCIVLADVVIDAPYW